MSQIRFSAFADLHHYPGVFFSQAEERLEAVRQRAVENNVDFVISCGDFCHSATVSAALLEKYDAFPMPVHHVIGNHDSDQAPYSEVLRRFHLDCGHYFFDQNGFRFIIVDTNYVLIDGEYRHYDLGNYYAHRSTSEYVPPAEIEWLRETVRESPYPCILFSHGSLERSNDVPNYEEILELIDDANRLSPGKVRMAINGHHHADFLRIRNDVVFLDLNSISYYWFDIAHDLFPKEFCEKHILAKHTVVYEKPVHAIITLDTDGTICIDGMTGGFYKGIDGHMTPNKPFDASGRLVTANVSSARFRMCYR